MQWPVQIQGLCLQLLARIVGGASCTRLGYKGLSQVWAEPGVRCSQRHRLPIRPVRLYLRLRLHLHLFA